ncbi:MAG TPA: VOC family protein [Candidatus Binataceae bacterium]|nr:VOC family protein [Candidatus Binataceae bacterium]
MANEQGKYDVGGVLMDRPFKIRRLGHFGINLGDLDAGRHFYSELLGFRVSDVIDLSQSPRAQQLGAVKDPRLIFTTYGTDHHAFVIGHHSLMGDARYPEVNTNQITWQLGTLNEVVQAIDYLRKREVPVVRTGRDMPGSNWHVYMKDPDGHTIELYYGMEQVGWNLQSKPREMYYRRFNETPQLPQIGEEIELEEAYQKGINPLSGQRLADSGERKYNVGGVLLPRPFKITRIGPVGLFVKDLAAAEAFYSDILGFIRTEEVNFKGRRCVFMRNGTEHHSLGLFPVELRAGFNLNPRGSLMSFGCEVGSYEQLRNAVRFLKEQGVHFNDTIPPDLYPGIDYAAHALDPEGNCIQLYYYMEQIGWDGKPRPKELRRPVASNWPDHLEALSDTYLDQTFQGPLG